MPNPAPSRQLPDQFDPDPLLQELLDRLTSYYPRAIDPNLERTIRLLGDLGNPHLALPPVIHVAGTNGKGSTLAYLRAIFESTGLSCHVMTSPHLVRFNERLVTCGTEMSTQDILALFKEVESINAGKETTSFELITAAGFLAFSRILADVTLLEVGMGGRFDATNVVQSPAATIIMSIAKDHTKFLGEHLDQIAFEKAGIIKQETPCIIGPQSQDALSSGVMDVFTNVAHEKSAPLYRYGHEWSYDVLGDKFILHYGANIFEFPKPNLIGSHQIGNAATAAIGAILLENHFKRPINLSNIEYGLTHAKWPARLQKLKQGPLVDLLPPAWELWIDGGHNDGCGAVLADQLKLWNAEDNRKTHLVLGMLGTKDPQDFAKLLLPLAASAWAVTIPDQPLSLRAEELSHSLNQLGYSVEPQDHIETAIKNILGTSREKEGRILITGSLYLMGAILKDHD